MFYFHAAASRACRLAAGAVVGGGAGDLKSQEGQALVEKYHALFVAGLRQVRVTFCPALTRICSRHCTACLAAPFSLRLSQLRS